VAIRPAPPLLAGEVRARLTRYSDLALAALVVSIVGMMIVPLPAFLLDLLISLNIAVAVVLLLIAIYVSDALKIATFPTLLLLTTLFRLALEVSATRLILLHASAGQVIRAFGNFVVAGNLVVGAVIFLILTLIQFIVIAKGSERVAEVAARFTLDALPGKQMSIDAELRAGHLDVEEARRRRAALARESQLFGAMDGAMKFVKGDAVAGLVVLVVNILGGLVIGVLQRGMDAASAARTYTLLTVGAGLVAQIPALVISTAAGIIVTRVASEEQPAGEATHLGRDIGLQILAQPRAIAVAAGLLGLLALVPGLPAGPFALLAALLGAVAWKLLRSPVARSIGAGALGLIDGRRGAPLVARRPAGEPAPTLVPAPIIVELSAELSAELSLDAGREGDGRLAAESIPAAGARLFAETGLTLPPVGLRWQTADLGGRAYRLLLNEVPLAAGEVPPGARDMEERVCADLIALMRRHGHELIGIQETQGFLDALEATHPALVREVVPKLVSPALLADVLRRLAREGISLRHLPDILGALAIAAPIERDAAALTEHARAALRRAITFQHAPGGVVGALLLDPIIEDTLRQALHRSAAGTTLALDPQLARDVLAAVGAALAAAAPAGPRPVILTTAELRRHVRQLVESEHPTLAVLSYPELAPEAKVQTVARIRIAA
jgi:type III secretion protein V